MWKAVIQHLESSSEVAVKIEEAFEAANTTGGLLHIEELSVLLVKGGITLGAADLAVFCESLDKSQTGKVSFEEFFVAVKENKSLQESPAGAER